MPRLIPRFALPVLPTLLALFVVGCASTGPRPGTGDVSFRLLWDGPADLDLHVDDPNGRHVGVQMPWHFLPSEERDQLDALRRSLGKDAPDAPGEKGILDIDCNASADRMCARPIENVYWPAGTASRGLYRVRVVLFQKLNSDEEIPFVLEIRQGERVVRKVPGAVGDATPLSDWIEFEH